MRPLATSTVATCLLTSIHNVTIGITFVRRFHCRLCIKGQTLTILVVQVEQSVQ